MMGAEKQPASSIAVSCQSILAVDMRIFLEYYLLLPGTESGIMIVFAANTAAKAPNTFQLAGQPQKLSLPLGASALQTNTWLLWPNRLSPQLSMMIGSAILLQFKPILVLILNHYQSTVNRISADLFL